VDDGDHARSAGGHHSSSVVFGCFGRRRYTVFGTSILGGFRGIGFRTRAWRGFRRFTRLV
jgi:hypothetical protein